MTVRLSAFHPEPTLRRSAPSRRVECPLSAWTAKTDPDPLETFRRSAYCGASSGTAAMRHLMPALLTTACVLGGATDASACRMMVPRADELAQRAIILATVKRAERIESPGWNTWRIVAERALDGESEDRAAFEFTTTLSSSGCGQTPLPPSGERWVLYLDRAGMGEVLRAFPLDYVKDYDVRLADVR